MTEQTKIPLAGVIGHPIGHSRSPMLHGHWLRRYGISGHYIPMAVEPTDLAAVLAALPKAGFVGCNVTIPHKEAALTLAQHVSDRAALIGAANTLTFRDDGSIYADNTDGYGFMANLHQYAPDWDPRSAPAAVLGAGGAARAIVSALLDAGVPEIRIANRTRSRADQLRAHFGARLTVYDWARAGTMFAGAGLAVNTTSLGMTGKTGLHIPMDDLGAQTLVTDLVYTPLRTGFLEQAAARGCHTVDGLGMLLHQAAPGFERWFGTRPVIDDDLRDAVLNV